MPDRILRAGILSSDAVNLLSWGAEVFYRRLHSVADDYGRYDGRHSMLRSQLYPLKVDRVSEADVGKWLTECVNAGLVSFYQVSGRPYVEVQKFDQRIQGKPKYPGASASSEQASTEIHGEPPCSTVDSSGTPESTALFVDGDVFEKSKDQKPIAPSPAAQAPAEGVVMLPLNDGTEYPVTQAQVDEFAELYPAVDVIVALRKMRGWCIGKPKNRKTRRGVLAFVTAWLAKDQDAGGARNGEPHANRFRDPAESLAQRAERKLREGDAREQQRAADELF